MQIKFKRTEAFTESNRIKLTGSGGELKVKPAGTAALATSGLVLHYDIGNPASYPGSGTTVTDIQGNSNATLANSPTFSAGALTFDGVDQALKTSTGLGPLFSGTSPFKSEVTTVMLWVQLLGEGNILVERGTSTYTDMEIGRAHV